MLELNSFKTKSKSHEGTVDKNFGLAILKDLIEGKFRQVNYVCLENIIIEIIELNNENNNNNNTY